MHSIELYYYFRPRILADPVSIAIALQAAQRSTIQEGQLTYGFKKRPIDQLPRRKVYPNVPEEKMFDLKSRVIEYKKPTDSEEDEFKIDESDEEYSYNTPSKSKSENLEKDCLYTYSDIGYSESTDKGAKFVNVPLSTTPGPYIEPITESDCDGRIINLPEEGSQSCLDQLLAEYVARECGPKETLTR